MAPLYLWTILSTVLCTATHSEEESRTFATCGGDIDINRPYRVVVDETDRGDANTLKFQQFEVPSTASDLAVNDILIQVKAAGVNYIDTYHRTGLYPGVTQIGLEGSGIVKLVGKNVTQYAVNDKVFWFGIQGSYATHLVVSQDTLSLNKFTPAMQEIINTQDRAKKDPQYIYKIGASIGIQVLTAHYLASSITNIDTNSSVLVHSGAGGTGNVLLQILKNVFQAQLVITTIGNENKAAIVNNAGADAVIVGYDAFRDAVMRFTSNEGVDVVFDGVGRSTWKQSLQCVKPRGWIVYFGNASGKIPNVDILEFTQQGSISVIRPSLRHYVRTKHEIEQRFKDIFEWIKDGKLSIAIGHEFNLYDVKQAQQLLESRKSVNKIILSIP